MEATQFKHTCAPDLHVYTLSCTARVLKSPCLVPGLCPTGYGKIGNEVDNTASQPARCMIKIFRGGEGVVDGEGLAVKDA